MVFTDKKVDLPNFGEKLKKARQEAGLSVNKVAQILNIQVSFLEHLEKGETDKMLADVYVRGFLRKYAGLLGLEPEKLLVEYDQETKIARHLNKTPPHQSLPVLRASRFVVTPKSLSVIFVSLIIIIAAGYFFYQISFLIGAPTIDLKEPAVDLITQKTDIIVMGKTEPGVILTINGQQVFTDLDGNFERTINLSEGINLIKIEATNRFGRSNSVIRQVMVK
jgi:transcriptional regulator with XRE-family HTH domain